METMLLKPDNLVEGKILLNKPLGGYLTFSRVGAKNVLDSRAELKKLTDNFPPLTYRPDGSMAYRFEPTITNLLPYSDTSDFTLTNVTRGVIQSYNGINGYNYLIQSAPYISKDINTTSVGYYTFSCFVDVTKSIKYDLRLAFKNTFSSAGAIVVFDSNTLSFGAITEDAAYCQNSTAKATQWYNNIWRLEITTEAINVGMDRVKSTIRVEDNISDVWLGGAQLEQGDGATSLIETTDTRATRLADSASLTNLFTKGLLTATAGAVYVELEGIIVFRKHGLAILSIGDTNGRLYIYNNTNSAQYPAVYIQNTDSTLINHYLTQKSNKILFNYSASNVDVWVNGVKVLSSLYR